MPAKINLTGQRFGRLIALRETDFRRGTFVVWECLCDCGNTTLAASAHLRSGNTTSCGCYRKEQIDKSNTKHGMWGTGIYSSWHHMKQRCLNPNNNRYKCYGGEGKTVCDKWLEFEGFLEDMGPSHVEGLTIERIDNSKGYFKENCKWIPREEQPKNQRRNST